MPTRDLDPPFFSALAAASVRVLILGLPRAPIETIMTPFFSAQAAATVRVLIVGLPRAPIETIMTPCLYAQAAASVLVPHFRLTDDDCDPLFICAGCGLGACFLF